MRAYLWAAAYARRDGIAFDAELLYVSAMLHDIGLVKEFDNHTVPFEEAGGHVAWVFGAAAGWPVARRLRAAEVIVRHMWDEVDVAEDPEGHLLELSTGMDISGRRTEEIPAGLAGRCSRATRGSGSPRSSSRASGTRRRKPQPGASSSGGFAGGRGQPAGPRRVGVASAEVGLTADRPGARAAEKAPSSLPATLDKRKGGRSLAGHNLDRRSSRRSLPRPRRCGRH